MEKRLEYRISPGSRTVLTILSVLIVSGSVAAYLFHAPVPGVITAIHPVGSEGTGMTGSAGNGAMARTVAIPSIDTTLPGRMETATFALG